MKFKSGNTIDHKLGLKNDIKNQQKSQGKN
jgi:hypothetical protein